MENLAGIIGERIRIARKKAGLSQEKLAELAGVHPTYVGQLERGEKNATIESIYRISSALNTPLDRLFEKIDSTPLQTNRNIPLECYNLILSKSDILQEKLFDIISEIDKLSQS